MSAQVATASSMNSMSSKKAGKQPVKGGKQPSKDDNKGDMKDDKPPKKVGRKHNLELPDSLPNDYDIAQIPISAAELCTYFPNHSSWFQYLVRLLRNGWAQKDIGKAQLHARGTLSREALERRYAAIRYQVLTAAKDYYGDSTWTLTSWQAPPRHPDSVAFTAAPPGGNFIDLYDVARADPGVWRPPRATGQATKDATLWQLVNGVVNHPQGQDAGALTQLLQHGLQQGRPWLEARFVSQIPGLITSLGFQPPTEATTTALWDQGVHSRLPANP